MKLFIAAFLILAIAGCSSQSATIDPDAATGTVTVEVVIGDEVKVWTIDDVADGSTLENVLRTATDFPIEISGSGTTAFVNAIAGKATSASEGWTYTVNGTPAPAGIGSTTITPPATVRWTFTSADEMFQ